MSEGPTGAPTHDNLQTHYFEQVSSCCSCRAVCCSMLAHFEQNDVVAALPEDAAGLDGAPARREFHSLLQIPVPSADPDRPLHVLQVYTSDAERAEWGCSPGIVCANMG